MKLKIKVKYLKPFTLIEVSPKGEWIDLRAAEDIVLKAPQAKTLKKHKVNGVEEAHRDVVFDSKLIPLGVAIKLPEGFEAVVLPRSSTFKRFGITMTNNQGVIDSSYCGDNDEWKFPAVAFRDTEINAGNRICQFKIQLSQKASMWQKLKWLLSSGVKIVEVESLDNNNRGGFGSTGIN